MFMADARCWVAGLRPWSQGTGEVRALSRIEVAIGIAAVLSAVIMRVARRRLSASASTHARELALSIDGHGTSAWGYWLPPARSTRTKHQTSRQYPRQLHRLHESGNAGLITPELTQWRSR